MRTNTHGIASQRGTATSADGSATCEMSIFISRQRSLTWISLGARLLSRLTGSARTRAETIELDQIRRSPFSGRDTREGKVAGVKCLLKSLERAMGMEAAFCSRHESLSGTGRGKGTTRLQGGSVHDEQLLTRCFDCNRFGDRSGDPITMHRCVGACYVLHIGRDGCVFIPSRLSRAQFRLNKSLAGQEHVTLLLQLDRCWSGVHE